MPLLAKDLPASMKLSRYGGSRAEAEKSLALMRYLFGILRLSMSPKSIHANNSTIRVVLPVFDGAK